MKDSPTLQIKSNLKLQSSSSVEAQFEEDKDTEAHVAQWQEVKDRIQFSEG
jgi:hypothetical protein